MNENESKMPSPKTILLIDDDVEDQEIFAHALRYVNPDIECVAHSEGDSAIALLQSNPGFRPDLIFIDVSMPRMGGIECLSEIKKIPWLHNVPVYLYSTYADPMTRRLAKEFGAIDIMIKANTMNDLRQMLQSVTDTNFKSHMKAS